MQVNILTFRTMLEALEAARDWNNADIRGFEDIAPDLPMLRARRRVLAKALAQAREVTR